MNWSVLYYRYNPIKIYFHHNINNADKYKVNKSLIIIEPILPKIIYISWYLNFISDIFP